jgi:serine/threonine protein phosphatase PrpC
VLRDMLAGGEDPAALAADLVRAALDRGSRDNVTALVVRKPPVGP